MSSIAKLLKGKKLLIVDNNTSNRLFVTSVLERFGVIVSESKNSDLAEILIRKTNFDIVLIDIHVANINAYKTTEIIRSKSNIPFIALTGNAIKEESEKGCLDVMNGYLSKPFTEEELLQVVSEHLQVRRVQENSVLEPEAHTALYNLTQLEAIAKGNQQFIDKMVRIFLEQTPSSCQEIKNAFKAQDFNRIMQIAHKIKPMIDMMGIVSLKNEVRILEKESDKFQDLTELDTLVNYFTHVLDQVVDSLNKSYEFIK